MARIFGRSALILAALGMAGEGPAIAQERPTPLWQVDWGEQFCSLIRLPDRSIPFALALRLAPGNGSLDMVLLRRGSARLPAGLTAVALTEPRASFEIQVGVHDSDQLQFNSPTDGFWDVITAAGELQLKQRTGARYRIPLADARGALQALRRCESEVMREWGIDEAQWRSLRRRPESGNLLGLRFSDYPEQALAGGTSGRVMVRVAVSAEGRPTECVPVATSGAAALDARTCQVIMARARFRPALGAAGQPVAARSIFKVTWLTPPGQD